MGKSWKAEAICPIIKRLEQAHNSFKYACCDNGHNLRKALIDSGIPHVKDCGHLLGGLMQKKYKGHATFKNFSEQLRKFKLSIQAGKYAAYIPPKWRTKGRFMNLWAVCEWAKKMLNLVRYYQDNMFFKEVLTKLVWLEEYEDFIEKLYAEQQLINKINKELKHFGLTAQTLQKCKTLIANSGIDVKLKEQMEEYLSGTWNQVKAFEKVIISSDIIESIFGRFKHRVANHPQGGITPGCLTIANYDKELDSRIIKDVFEKVKMIDVENWRKENLSISIFQKKKRLFKNTG